MPINRIDIGPLLPALARKATVLVPNHRIRDAILGSYANTINGTVFATPQVLAIDIWLRDLWDLSAHSGISPCARWQLLTPVQEHFIWTGVIEQSLAQLPLLNPEETAAAVNDSYRNLRQWVTQEPLTRLQQFTDAPDVKAFAQWIKTYQEFCAQHQVISLVDAILKLLNDVDFQWAESPFLPAEICLANFFEAPPLYRQLFNRLGTVADVSEYSLFDTGLTPELSRYAFTDQLAEIMACATWAKNLKQNKPEQHLGIICSEDLLSQPALCQQLLAALSDQRAFAIPEQNELFNSSGSHLHLADTGLVHDAFLLLNLMNEEQASSDLSRLLQSPYLLAADSENEARLQMELQMRRYFTATTTIADFSWHLQQPERSTYAPQLAAALLQARTRLRQFPARATASEWVLQFAAWLADFGWPGNSLSRKDCAALAQWREVLRALAMSSTVLGSLTAGAAVSKLKTLCLQQTLGNAFRADNSLSIYSVAESTGLQFDQVWLVGFDDQTWPPAAHPSPFIPYALQKEAQIPGSHSDLQLQRAGRQFAILKTSVKTRIIASHHRSNGELECSPSSFISAWPELPMTAAMPVPPQPTPVFDLQQIDCSSSLPLEIIPDLPGFPLLEQETVRGGQGIISNQSSCPFRAFARHRLQAETLEPFPAGLSMRDRGSALHAALELLFTSIDSRSSLLALEPVNLESVLTEAANHAIDFLRRRHRALMTPRFQELEQQRIRLLLHKFLELESGREDFRVLAREAPFDWHYDKLHLHLKIDRIDVLGDASLALIDYKSGKRITSSQSWLESRPEDMQLPLYYTVAADLQQEPVSAVAIAHVNTEKFAYSGLVASANVHASLKPVGSDKRIAREWQEITAQWQDAVHQRALEFTSGVAQVAPVHGRRTCEYCGLQALCRIQELDTSNPDDEPEQESEA